MALFLTFRTEERKKKKDGNKCRRERWEWTSAIELDDALQSDNRSKVTFGDSVMDYKNAIPRLKLNCFLA